MRRSCRARKAAQRVLRLSAPDSARGDASRIPLVMLSLGQLVSWGTLYYGITFVAEPIRHETGWGLARIFGAFSAGLLVAAVAAPLAGRMIHRHGGRAIMSAGSLLAAAALAMVASSKGFLLFQAGWLLAGIAMSLTLYEAAFSTLRELSAIDFRRGVGAITIVGGFASTLFWPLTHWLAEAFGWRASLLIYAGMHLLLCFPMHFSLKTRPLATDDGARAEAAPAFGRQKIAALAIAFALASLVTAAISSHASLLMAHRQVPEWLAMAALAMIGPMQVAGRIAELSMAHRMTVARTGMAALIVLAASMLMLQLMGLNAWLALAFAIAYGAANGVMTVVRGTVLAELFGAKYYAPMLGMLSAPALFARALGPMLMAWAISVSGMSAAVWMLALLMLLAVCAYGYASNAPGQRVSLSGPASKLRSSRSA